jgi:hypothetical protein
MHGSKGVVRQRAPGNSEPGSFNLRKLQFA